MIDGGPLRIPRPTGRQVEYRSESVRRQPEEPQQMEPQMVAEPPRRAQEYRQVEPEPIVAPAQTARNFGWIKWVFIVLAVAGIAAAGWMALSKDRGIAATIDADKYQAVFLSNGQVYFGKLAVISGDFMQLTNVYYLERQLTADTGSNDDSDQNEQPTAGDNNFQLLKYSDVLYGSEDAMIISQDDIIRFENLRSDGVVAKAIANRR